MNFIVENVLAINWIIWISWIVQLVLYFKFKDKRNNIFWIALLVLFLSVVGKAMVIVNSLGPGPYTCDPYMTMSILSLVVGLVGNVLVYLLSGYF